MKTLALLTTALLIFASCGKIKEENDAFNEVAEDYALAESVWDDLGEQVEGSAENVEAGENSIHSSLDHETGRPLSSRISGSSR